MVVIGIPHLVLAFACEGGSLRMYVGVGGGHSKCLWWDLVCWFEIGR